MLVSVTKHIKQQFEWSITSAAPCEEGSKACKHVVPILMPLLIKKIVKKNSNNIITCVSATKHQLHVLNMFSLKELSRERSFWKHSYSNGRVEHKNSTRWICSSEIYMLLQSTRMLKTVFCNKKAVCQILVLGLISHRN